MTTFGECAPVAIYSGVQMRMNVRLCLLYIYIYDVYYHTSTLLFV